MAAFTVLGRADQTSDPAAGDRDLQLHQDVQFVMSATVLDFKTVARKASSSWSGCVECLTGRAFEYQSAITGTRPEEGKSPQMRLEDLRALRGRAPPRESRV